MALLPDEEGIRQTLELLHNSQSSDTSVQKAVHEVRLPLVPSLQKLNELNNFPDFNKYLAYILLSAVNESKLYIIQ